MASRFLLLASMLPILAIAAIQGSATASHTPSHPCDLVASTAGSNANPGTLEQPFATVQKLVNSLQPGQTGCLRGTAASQPFTQNVTVANKNASGATEANRITIRSYPGEIAKLRGRLYVADDANYITFSKLVLDGRDAVNNPPTLTSPRIDGDHVALTDNNITTEGAVPCVRLGLAGKPAVSPLVSRNRIHDCLDAISTSEANGGAITDNLVYDNAGWGLRIGPNGDSAAVTHNILDSNHGGVLFSGDATNNSIGNAVSRNVIAKSSPNPNVDSSFDPFNTPPIQFNFVSQSCVYKPPADDGDYGVDASGGGFNATLNDDKDPGYNSATNDFHIAPTNPCYQHSGDVAATVEAGGGPTDEQATANNSKPNVLFIVTDDQRAGETIRPQSMPQVIARMRDAGTEYANAFATTPLCCPGRSSIFSGRYAHNHGVHSNPFTANLDHATTLQRYLQDAGYRTGIFGKFLNDWDLNQDPPYWDRWAVFNNGHCGWKVNEQGELKSYGTFGNAPHCAEGAPYSADYIADQAAGSTAAPGTGFLDEAEADDSQPWFMYLAPFEPHGIYQPEYEYRDLDVGTIEEGPAHNEGQTGGDPITDKPQHIQWMCKENPNDATCTADPKDWIREAQLRMLRSVDDMIGKVLDELDKQGEQDTIIAFVSDNGFMWGEHGLRPTKSLPYTESIKIPFFMRYAPHTKPGVVDSSMVANIDLAPTVLDATDVSVPQGSPPRDGISLLDASVERNRMHTEWQNGGGTFSDDGEICAVGTPCFEPYETITAKWASTRTSSYQYIESYGDDGITVVSREYYLASDEDQLTNLFADGVPGNEPDQATQDALSEQLKRDRFCRGSECPGGGGQGPTDDPIDPLGYVTSPAPGGHACCRVHLRGHATDNLGVDWVQFYVDGNPVGAPDFTSPYEAIWDSNSGSQGPQVTQHEVRMLVGDSAARQAFSPIATMSLDKGLDIQIEDPDLPVETSTTNWNDTQRPDTSDTVTYSFGRTITPTDIVPGWNSSLPADCVTRPASCVTVRLINVPPAQGLTDTMKIFTNTEPKTELAQFGTVDLRFADFVGTNQDFVNSQLALVDGGKAIRVTLGSGGVAAHQWGVGTAVWNMGTGAGSICDGCKVFESIDGTDGVEDREW